MLLKKEGKVNELIYNNTVYNEGNSRHYLMISDLMHLMDRIVETNETTNYLRITPFYINAKLGEQMEFDDFMFYIECRERINSEDIKNHLSECMGRDYDISHTVKEYDDMSDEDKHYAHTMYPLCEKSDIKEFQKAIIAYKAYLVELIAILFEKVKIQVESIDYAFGCFCFEIHSG